MSKGTAGRLWGRVPGQHYTRPQSLGTRTSSSSCYYVTTSHPLAARTLVGATRWLDRLCRGRPVTLVRGTGGGVCVCGNVSGRDLEHKQPQCDASHNLILAI